MKIVYLLDGFPPESYSSASVIAFNLAKSLLELGHEIFVITCTSKKNEQGEENYKGIKIFRIYSQYSSLLRHWFEVFNIQTVFKVKRILEDIEPDICHFHYINQHLSYYCLRIARKYSKAVFITVHDVMLVHYGKLMFTHRSLNEGGPKYSLDYKISFRDQIKEAGRTYNPFRNLFIRHYLNCVDKIFAVSNSLKNLLAVNGIKNVETIYNGINVDEWQENYDEVERFKKTYNILNKKIIFFGGRISGAKGGDQILKSLSVIKKTISDIILIVVGEENQYTDSMKRTIPKLRLNENVVFAGSLKNNELKAAYHAADICVSPSLCFETFGMINLEAMACKKPVVSSYFGGPSEVVVDEETGYFVNPYNIDLMAQKILDILSSPQKAKEFGEAGHKRVKNFFSLNRQVEETLKWYKNYV